MENTELRGCNAIKGIIFDYGGTLDSRGVHWSEVIWAGYRAARVDIPRELFREAYVFAERELARNRHILPHHNFYDLLLIKMKIELGFLVEKEALSATEAARLAPIIARYCYEAAATCVNEAKPILDHLSERYPMVLVSNFYGNVEAVLEDFGLRKYFRSIIESAVVGVRKPDPRIFSLGAEALGMKPEDIIVIGDSLKKDILPAESIGCHTAWLKGKGWTAEEDSATHPGTFTSLEEIAKTLL